MIDLTLKLICDRLNAHLSALYSVPDGLVAIGPLNDSEGKPTAEARNKLTIFVTNLAQDSMPRNGTTRSVSQIGQARPVHLDIYFMLASGYDAEIYEEGLKLISSALMFFQSNAVMTPQNTPEMPSGISQLSIDIANLKVEEIGQLWGNLGGRYVPSVMFKVRSVIIDAGLVQTITPLIRAPSSDAKAEAG